MIEHKKRTVECWGLWQYKGFILHVSHPNEPKEPFRNNLYIGPAFVNAFRADGLLHT